MGCPAWKQAGIAPAVVVTDRSRGERQHGERWGRQPCRVPICMAALQTASPQLPRVLENCLCGFWSLCSQMDPLLLQILISLQDSLCKHRRKNIVWGTNGILQKVTFLEYTLEPDVPLKVFVVRDYAEKIAAKKRKTQNYSTLDTWKSYTKRKKYCRRIY